MSVVDCNCFKILPRELIRYLGDFLLEEKNKQRLLGLCRLFYQELKKNQSFMNAIYTIGLNQMRIEAHSIVAKISKFIAETQLFSLDVTCLSQDEGFYSKDTRVSCNRQSMIAEKIQKLLNGFFKKRQQVMKIHVNLQANTIPTIGEKVLIQFDQGINLCHQIRELLRKTQATYRFRKPLMWLKNSSGFST